MPRPENYKRSVDRRRSQDDEKHDECEALLNEMTKVFSENVVNELRRETGYNPRQRVATAYRLLHACVEACLCGKTLGFASIRSFFVKRFGSIRPRAFQLRFKSTSAVAFFRGALDRIVTGVTEKYSPRLTKHLAGFDDVIAYDGTGQRAPKRGRNNQLKAAPEGSAGSKWIIGYSLRNGIAIEARPGEGRAAEIPLWKQLVPKMRRNVLYLLDLGFYCRHVFEQAIAEKAHVLMRLKADEKNVRSKLRVVNIIENGGVIKARKRYTASSYIRRATRLKLQTIDIDVFWGMGKSQLLLRVVGVRRKGQWYLYLTTVPREMMSVEIVVESYRLRWLIEFLFREWKQETDWGRSTTADKNALEALTYAALISHALVRSIRIATALQYECELDAIRPLACMHVVRAYSGEIVSALLSTGKQAWMKVAHDLLASVFALAHEPKPSRSRPRIAHNLGALGG